MDYLVVDTWARPLDLVDEAGLRGRVLAGGPLNARGIGEPPLGPPAAAIASAIHDAIGVRPTRLPITPGRILELVDR